MGAYRNTKREEEGEIGFAYIIFSVRSSFHFFPLRRKLEALFLRVAKVRGRGISR